MTARNATIAALAAIAALVAVPAGAQQVTPDQLKFQRNPATGSEVAVVLGDPKQAGPVVSRVKYPPGLKAMPHSHPNDVQVTVLSGTLFFAEGETFDESKLKAYPAGSFLLEKANVPHYQMAKEPVVFQASTVGPTVFNFVNPEHDPRKQKK